MFLHAGASLHGHEYSNRPTPQIQSPAHLRTPLLRSALSAQKQRVHTDTDTTPAPSLRQRPASDYVPRDPSPVVRFREPEDEPPPTPATTHDESISESELSDATLSFDGPVSRRPARRRQPHRVQRKTTYYLGYPTPRIIGKTKVMQKVFLPRLLLQLQKVGEDGRPQPVLEVFPASRIAGPVVAPRLSKRFPGIFGVKRHLGYDDIVLVRRDDSVPNPDGGESEHEESLEWRNLLAVYSPLKHSEEAEIVLDDGSLWVARPLPNGSFDFVYTDAEGNITTARWARRHSPSVTPATDSSSSSTAPPQPRYTFSILNPLTRRHPVLATLTPSTLDVQDTYISVSSSHALHPPITRIGRSQSVTTSSAPCPPPRRSTGDSVENDPAIYVPSSPDTESNQRTVYQIDDHTKMLIAVTAFWVALRSGWSQTYSPSLSNGIQDGITNTPAPASLAACHRSRSRRHTWTRSSTSDTPRSDDVSGGESFRENSGTARVGGGVFKRHSLPATAPDAHARSTAPTPSVSRTSTPTSTISSVVPTLGERPLPRRATSTGAAFMQRHLQSAAGAERGAAAAVSSPANGMDRGGAASERGEGSEGEAATGNGTGTGYGSWRGRHIHLHLHHHTKHVSLQVPPPASSPSVGAQGGLVNALQPRSPLQAEKRFTLGPAWQSENEGNASDGAVVKKAGVRFRLARWIRGIGSGSGSGSSSK
ncbi:hypothetical protein VTI74DRAFT_9031 [Chaetomium olivicolor]